jgi:hypothetical protein
MKPLVILLAFSMPALAIDHYCGVENFYVDLDYLGPQYYVGKPWFEDVIIGSDTELYPVAPELGTDVFDRRCASDLTYVECLQLKILLD